MKSIVLSSVVTALLVFSGCSTTKPAVDESVNESKVQEQQPVQEVAGVEVETISADNASVIDQNGITNADSNEMEMANIEAKMQTIYFDFDKFNIRADMQDEVANDVDVANNAASNFMIKLQGNCDEWGSDEYNFALGLKRASSVKKALIADGVEQKRITMVSYGESNPVCTDKTKECWSKNRRVDFKLLP